MNGIYFRRSDGGLYNLYSIKYPRPIEQAEITLEEFVKCRSGGSAEHREYVIGEEKKQVGSEEKKQAGSVDFIDVKERFTKNWILGDLFVIQGTVVNKYEHPISRVKVRGKILNTDGKVLDEAESYCGNLLTDEELGNLTEKEIAEELSIQIGSDISNDSIAPEGEIPFMIVFTNPPKEAEEFIVELVNRQLTEADFEASFREAELREKDYYKKAWEELEAGNYDKSIYAQAFAKANGNADKAKALYIKIRLKQLKEEFTQ